MATIILPFIGVEDCLALLCGYNVSRVVAVGEQKGGHCLVELLDGIELKSGQTILHYKYDQDIYDEIEYFSMRVNDVTKKMGRSHRFSKNDPHTAKIAGYMLERVFAYWLKDNGISFYSGGYMRTKQDAAQQDFIVYGRSIGCKCKIVEESLDHTLKKYSSWLYPAKDIESKWHLLPTPDYAVFGLHDANRRSLYIFGWATEEMIRRGYLKWINGYATRMVPKRSWNSMNDLKVELDKYKDKKLNGLDVV